MAWDLRHKKRCEKKRKGFVDRKHLRVLRENFLGGLVAKTPSSQCREPGFDPWSGNYIPHAPSKSLQAPIKKKQKNKKNQNTLQATTKIQHS